MSLFVLGAIQVFAQAPAPQPAAPVPAKSEQAKKGEVNPSSKEAPLSLKDVLQLRQKLQPDDVLGQALERGIDFEVTKPIHAQLSKLGFTPVQLENLRSARGIEPLPAIVPGQFLTEDEELRDLRWQDFSDMAKAAAKDLTPVQTPHLTLWAPKNLQANVLAELKKMDALLESKFQEPLRSGLDCRSSHIVLLQNQTETIAWFSKYYDVMDIKTKDPEGKAGYLKRNADGAMTNMACVINLQVVQEGKLKNQLGLYVGYMAFYQLSANTVVKPLVTGFANEFEGLVVGAPETPIVSRNYGTNELGPDGREKPWSTIAKQRLAAGKLTRPSVLLKLTTMKMELPELVESWTLVDLLVRDRVKFGKLVYKLREEKDGLKAIEAVYGWNEAELTKRWMQHIRN